MNGQLSLISSQAGYFSHALKQFSSELITYAHNSGDFSFTDIETVKNIDNALISARGLTISLLYTMREKKGWMILGFSSFEEYGKARFGFSRQHVMRLADSYKILEIVEPNRTKDIAESVTRPLNDSEIPDEIKKRIWNEAKSEHEKVTAKIIAEKVSKFKAENAQLQQKLDAANHKLASVETLDVESIIAKTTEVVSSDMQRKIDDVTDKLWKEKNEKTKLEQRLKNESSSNSEELKERISVLDKQIADKQNQLEQFNLRLESEYTDLHVNENLQAICGQLGEQVALTIAELMPLKNASKNVYETTNAQIYGAADLLEELAKNLRQFATDYAEFTMSSTTIQ